MKLFPLLLLATLPLRAATTEAVSEVFSFDARDTGGTDFSESGVFSFDIRDSNGTTEAVSAVFSMNARNLGNSASSASSVFALGTQGGNLDALVIDANAPSSVIAGLAYAFPVKASFAGQGGGLTDVSTAAKWFIVGNAPAGTRFEGNKLIAGSVTVPTVIRVSAVFVFPSGAREAVPWEVTIHPATPGYVVEGSYDPPQLLLPGGAISFRVTFHATSNSPQGAAASQNVFWDLDGDGDFDDATGNQTVRDLLAGQTVRIGVRAEWPLGVGPPASAADYFFVTLDRNAVPNEPLVSKVVDALNGSFLNSSRPSAAVFTPSPALKSNGLVILTHGLWGGGEDEWLKEMREAILTRLGSAPPNVAIYDWKKMADATAYRSNGQTKGADQWALFKIDDVVLVRPNGKAQGAMIADWVERQRLLGNVDRNAKIHFIGHSAGGFAVGEAARLLNQRLYGQIQVTMLDTPLPYHEHIRPLWRTERYVSSWIGGNPKENWQAKALDNAAKLPFVNSQVERFVVPSSNLDQGTISTFTLGFRTNSGIRLEKLVPTGAKYYRTVIDPHADGLLAQHYASHEYYTATIYSPMVSNSTWLNDVVGDGFNQSFLVDGADFGPSPQAIPAPQDDGPQPSPPHVPPMEDFSTFGQVAQSDSYYTVTEQANAGIFKTFTLPAWAATLQFQVRVATPGDGDFVSVHWNDGDALAIIPEIVLAYDAPLLHAIDLTGLGGQTGTLTIKLNSRGSVNSAVEISEVRIFENGDLDGDGLANATEQAVGSNPLEIDTDGDTLSDADEVLTHGTSPVKADTDGDGQGDSGELAAGTDPSDPQSRFVAAMGDVSPGDFASVWWNGVAGRDYRVVRSQELGTLNLDFLQSGIEGTAGPMLFEDESAPENRAFYWIEVE
jgi:hypothetical protein